MNHSPATETLHVPDGCVFVVLVGNDPVLDVYRRQLLDGQTVERIDLDDSGAVDQLMVALSSPALFGPGRTVDLVGFSTIDAAASDRLRPYATTSTARVVARADKPPSAAVAKRLGEVTHVETASIPTGRKLAGWVAAQARRRGVTLSTVQAATVASRLADVPERTVAVVEQLALVGLFRPSDAQVATLLGTANPPGVVWALTDAIEAGDVDAVATLAPTLDAQAALSWMVKRCSNVAVACEAYHAGDQVSSVVKGPPWQLERLTTLVRQLDPDDANWCARTAARAVAAARSSGGDADRELVLAATLIARRFASRG